MATGVKKLTFAEHIQELRKRLMWSLLFVAIGGVIGYLLHDTILELLQKPLNDSLYYTAPTGAFNFILKLCIVFGVVVALPVVVYQIFAFFGPLLPQKTKRSIVWYVAWSIILAALGIAFAYFVSLPAALHFLVNFGNNAGDIQALITADEYFNFVLAYIAGFAILFQLPLIVSFINRVRPMKPKQMLGGTRYVILGSFIVAAVITPTPDPVNQAIMAIPIILLYFLSIFVIIFMNRKPRRAKASAFPEIEISKLNDLLKEKNSPLAPVISTSQSVTKPMGQPVATLANNRILVQRPQRLVTDMVVPKSSVTQPKPMTAVKTTQPKKVVVRHNPTPTFRVGLISDFVISR